MNKVNSHKLNDPFLNDSLANLKLPLKQLFYSGVNPKDWINKPKLAIVGSRKMSPYGQSVTQRLAYQVAQAGAVIISGLAYGVDAAAHKAALEANGTTVAIMPTPLDKIYPAGHFGLAKEIMEQGSLLSEYGPGEPVYKTNFAYRNRIIAGLCDGLLITEAVINSGSLHTARFALELGKTVMAVPGNITSPTSEGCNNLIKSGAIAVTSIEDVFFALGMNIKKSKHTEIRGSKHERLVYSLIISGVSNQDELASKSDLEPTVLNGIITTLEINGHIKPSGAGFWHAI